ncbi:MAG: acyl transferase domain-containing protein, partial [Lentimonas sp.]
MSDVGVKDVNPEVDENDIAVIGMACRLPGAQSHQSFWENLKAGKEALEKLPDDALRNAGVSESDLANPNYVKAGMFLRNMECFDAGFFGFSPQDARIMDPQHRHFLECAWETFEDAGYVPDEMEGSIGVFAGSGHNAYLYSNLLSNPELIKDVGFFLLRHTGNDKDFLSTRVSYIFNLLGPSVNVQTACSTSLVAVHLASQSLLNGECDMALAGGVTIEVPHRQGYLYKENEILSKDGHCRPFELNSGGTVFGSGVGCVLLKRLSDALNDGDQIHAVVKSSAINNDGANKVSYLAPSVDGQAAAIREAIELANVEPTSVGFIECHGTGTEMGDPIEVAALSHAYGLNNSNKQYCALGSVKSNIGHLDTAAGVAGMIKTILCLKNRQLPPTLHFNAPSPVIDFANSPFYVNDRLRDWQSDQPLRAGVSSLGVGGTNAHIILEEAPAKQELPKVKRPFELLCFSGRSGKVIDQYASDYADFMASTDLDLADIAWTAVTGRKTFRHRRVAVAANKNQFTKELKDDESSLVFSHKAPNEPAPVNFMFAGGGAQHINMGRDLYDSEPLYKSTIDDCLKIANDLVDFDLRAVLYPEKDQEEQAKKDIINPTRALPALFITQYAQAKLWQSWGIQPDAMIGHSMGEYTAACLAGVFSPRDAIAMVSKRGELFEKLPPGAMLSVMLDENAVTPYLGKDLSIAAVNSPSLCVIAGPAEKIEALQEIFEKQETECRRVHISVAAHSAMLEPILEEFETFLNTIEYSVPQNKIASNVTGKWLSDEEAINPKYWVKHLRQTVRFADGLSLLLKEKPENTLPVLLEIGPGNTLSSLTKQHNLVTRDYLVASSMRHPKEAENDLAFMLLTFGKLWCGGVSIDWQGFYEQQDNGRQRVSVPTYPFEKQHYWIEPGRMDQRLPEGKQPVDKWFYQPTWQPSVPPSAKLSVPLVLFGDQKCPVVSALEKASGSSDLITVQPAQTFKELSKKQFEVNLSNLEQVSQLFEEIAKSHESGFSIAYAWPLTQPDKDAFEQFFNFSQILVEHDFSDLKLTILVNGALPSRPTESVERVELSTISGAARVLAKELTSASIRFVDIDDIQLSVWQPEKAATSLLGEITTPSALFEAVCYRAGYRYAENFAPVNLPLPESTQFDSGCYVITGGLGGLGLTVAEQLAKSNGIKLVLLSHREFPAKADWAQQSQRNTRTGRRVKRVSEIASRVDQLEVFQADVTIESNIRTTLDRVRAEFGEIKGVFHTAGMINDQLISMKNMETCTAVLRPKILGTRNLASALKDDSLDFLMLYSSVSALTGLSGQFDYASANAFLDSFAHQLRAQGIPAISVNWSAWQQVGMAAELASGERLMGRQIPAFETYLEDNHLRVYVDTRTWWVDEHRTKSGLALVPGTGYVDLAYQAAQRALIDKTSETNQFVKLSNIFFGSPLIIHDAEQKVIDIHIDNTSGTSQVMISSASSLEDADGENWLAEHAEGQVHIVSLAEKPQINIEKIRADCNKSVINRRGDASHEHMDFGKRWACVEKVYVGEKEVFVELALPENFVEDIKSSPLHPAMMDMSTGAGHILVDGYRPKEDFFVPVSYGDVTIFGAFEKEVFSHVQWLGNDGDNSSFDVSIYDKDGLCLMEIKKFVVKRMQANALDAIDQANTAELDVDLSLGILPEEGQEVIQRILNVPSCPQIIVSPECFDTVLANVRSREGHSKLQLDGIERPSIDSDFEEPETPFEIKMAELWSTALGIEKIGIHDNFFELGGHSLLLTQLATKAKKAIGVALPLSKLFDKPTIKRWGSILAELTGGDTQAGKADLSKTGSSKQEEAVAEYEIMPIARPSSPFEYHLSPPQSALWFIHEADEANSAYNIPVAMRYRGSLDIDALRSAFGWLVQRHEVLRTVYGEDHSGEMIQRIAENGISDFKEHNVGSEELESELRKAAIAPFDLRSGTPIVCHLFKVSEDDFALLLNVHHIAVDHLALLQLIKELEEAYQSFLLGKSPNTERPRIHYADYVNWLERQTDEEEQQRKLKVWKDRLSGFSGVLDLPLDKARPAIPSGKGAQLLFEVDKEVSSKVNNFSRNNSVSLYVSLLSAFSVLMSRYCSQEDVIIGTPFANRANQEELDDVVGCFINTLPLAINLAKCDSFDAVISAAKEVMLEAYDNQEIPLSKIVDFVHPVRDPSYNPLFQVGFIFQEPPAEINLNELSAEFIPIHSGGAMYDIHLWIWPKDDGLSGLVWYNTDVLKEKSVKRMKEHLELFLNALIDNPKSDFRELPLITGKEERLYQTMNDTSRDVPAQATLHGLIQQSCISRSSELAVIGQDGQISYGELEERSNLLAAYLISKNIGTGCSVG